MKTFAITIHFQYLVPIIKGTKIYEIRTRVPKSLQLGDKLLLIQTGSFGQVLARATVESVHVEKPALFFKKNASLLGINEVDFFKYAKDHEYLYFIRLNNIKIPTSNLTVKHLGLKRAPQWFIQISESINLSRFFS